MNLENSGLKIYFLGVGGISMSAIATYLKSKGFHVYGYDKTYTDITKKLISQNIEVDNFIDENKIVGSDILVYTDAIPTKIIDNIKEINKNLIIYSRVEILNIIASLYKIKIGISGTHGKTTATSMMSSILTFSKLDYTAQIGGEDYISGNLRLGKINNIFLTEVCEFSNNLSKINIDYAVCLNVDNDHIDSYGSFENLKKAFYNYLNKSMFKILNYDDEFLKTIDGYSYSIYNKSTYRAENIKNNNGKYSFDCYKNNSLYLRIDLNVYGFYNIYNALSTIVVADLLNIDKVSIISGLNAFKGVKRRYEYLGTLNGNKIIADYCHHPMEIYSVFKTIKDCNEDYIAIFQPHTYSRTKILMEDFVKVLKDKNVCIYKTFPARERYSRLGSGKKLAGLINKKYISSVKELKNYINSVNDKTIYILGAGDLYTIVKNFIK